MSVRNTSFQQKRVGSRDGANSIELSQLQSDLAGLERLQALQSNLIREIRRQVEELKRHAGE